ncbi:uncharacterized protein J4E88_006220 [Alternaria novae-zelandiae]|uniref:uncharacterized protein n=1 Tax=Alternaria novae-zelandiae TaxID=430562 RepID=UPI0020C512D7|nr:uncharacterized protein J4E88_006220 [Alternaria novae-zelandiae]KAI4678932.1 hypothetical protein J4E88_006220 [Alternaria novae-zelandiae]
MNSKNASLEGLPDELVQEIITHLDAIRSYDTLFRYTEHQKNVAIEANRQSDNHIRRLALYSLCLTSRCLRRMATPILYASFIGTAAEHGTEPLQFFRERILDSSRSVEELNKYLKYVEIRRMDKKCQNDSIPPHTVAQHYLTMLADVVKQAVNLQHLSIENIEDHERSFWRHLVPGRETTLSPTPNPGAEHVFSKLQTLCVNTTLQHYGLHAETISFDQICSVVSTAPMLTDFRARSVVARPPASMPQLGLWKTLQRLEITACRLEIEAVASILSACEGLRHVVCIWMPLEDFEGSPSDLYASLLRHADTLESLHLDIREIMFRSEEEASDSDIDEDYVEMVPLKPLGTLRPFERLSKLVISQNGLLGASAPYANFSRNAPPMAELLSPSLTSLTMLLGVESQYRMGYKSLDTSIVLRNFIAECRTSDLSLEDVSFQAEFELSAAPETTKAFLDIGVRYEQVLERYWVHDAFR